MTKKLLFLFLCLCSILVLNSQERIIITGNVIDSLGIVKNANIINLKINQGTFSSDNGLFRILAKKGDSLRVSSIQHITKIVVINSTIYQRKQLTIDLKSNIYQLDEFQLKRHNLSGFLWIDSKNVPTDKRDSLLLRTMDFSDVNMQVVEEDDYIDKRVRPPIVNTVTNSFSGLGTSVGIPFKYSERLWALRKKLEYKRQFPYVILSELGEKFFFEKLKIPVENYFHFLEYCNPLGIENLHKEGKLLDLITILRAQSKTYLATIKK